MSKSITASAMVEVTLIIESGSSWGDGCTIDQVHRQAIEGALAKLSRAPHGSREDFKLAGQPKVVNVISRIE